MKKISIFLLFLMSLYGYEVIDLNKTKYYYQTNSAIFIDARDFKNYQKGTIAKAINIPLKRYKRFKKFLPIDKNATIIIFCNDSNSTLSSKLAKKLETKFKYNNIKEFKEGFLKWKSLNLFIMAKPTKCNSITKKVRINGIRLVLNSNKSINKEWFNNLKKYPKGLLVVDLRTNKKYIKAHIKNAINMDFRKNGLNFSKIKDSNITIFYCNRGIISSKAKKSLDKYLQKKVFIIENELICNNKKCYFR